MKHLALGLILLLILVGALAGVALAQTGPQFRASFKALADQIPTTAGQPLEEEHWDPTGNLLQATTTGLMEWRRSDRWTLFTNGYMTWILGPYGLQSRLNTDVYPWESVSPAPSPASPPSAASAAAPTATPTPQPVATTAPATSAPAPTATPVPNQTYVPDVKAMSDAAGGHGVAVKSFVQALDDEWSRVWGWRPHRPVTIYVYMDGYQMAADYVRITGANLSTNDIANLAIGGAVVHGNDLQTGGYAILQNLNYRMGTDDWLPTTQSLVVHEYANVLITDIAGSAGPAWFREGFAEWCAYTKVTGTIDELAAVAYTSSYNKSGALHTLMDLNSSWSSIVSPGGQDLEAAYGTSYLAVKYLASRVGGMPLLQALQSADRGQDFGTALESKTGYSIQRLEAEYRSAMIPQ